MNLKENKLIIYSAIISFLGFLDSAYLAILHYKNAIPPCSVTNGCETVLTSKYAMVGPLPVSLLGAFFYLAVILLCILIITNYPSAGKQGKKMLLDTFYFLAVSGFIVSVVLIYIQAQILHAFCQYCLISEATSTGLLVLAFLKFKGNKKAY